MFLINFSSTTYNIVKFDMNKKAGKGYSGDKGVSPGPAPKPYIASNMKKGASPRKTESINWS